MYALPKADIFAAFFLRFCAGLGNGKPNFTYASWRAKKRVS